MDNNLPFLSKAALPSNLSLRKAALALHRTVNKTALANSLPPMLLPTLVALLFFASPFFC
jgi:hypothetical protein